MKDERTTEQEQRFSYAMKLRAEAAVLQAKADVLEGKDSRQHYEHATECFRLHAEAEMSAVMKALKQNR